MNYSFVNFADQPTKFFFRIYVNLFPSFHKFSCFFLCLTFKLIAGPDSRLANSIKNEYEMITLPSWDAFEHSLRIINSQTAFCNFCGWMDVSNKISE